MEPSRTSILFAPLDFPSLEATLCLSTCCVWVERHDIVDPQYVHLITPVTVSQGSHRIPGWNDLPGHGIVGVTQSSDTGMYRCSVNLPSLPVDGVTGKSVARKLCAATVFLQEIMSLTINVATVYPNEILSSGNTVARHGIRHTQ